MWTGRITELKDWSQFDSALRSAFESVRPPAGILVRNFETFTVTIDRTTLEYLGDVDRLDLVRRTGSDRDETSTIWNAGEFDFDHDAVESGKAPNDIIYAYRVDLSESPYLVHFNTGPAPFDLTSGLDDTNGIMVYDAAKFRQVAPNEYWFLSDPRDALLAVFVIA